MRSSLYYGTNNKFLPSVDFFWNTMWNYGSTGLDIVILTYGVRNFQFLFNVLVSGMMKNLIKHK